MKWLYTRADRYVNITKRLSYRLQRRRFVNYLEFHTSAYTDKRIGYRLQTMMVINKSLIDLYTPLNDFGITHKEGGLWTIYSFIELPTPPKDFGIAYNEVVIH